MAEAPATQGVARSRTSSVREQKPRGQNRGGRENVREPNPDEEEPVGPVEEGEDNLDRESKESLDEENEDSLDEKTLKEISPSSSESEEEEDFGDVEKNPAQIWKWLASYLTKIFCKFQMTSLLRDFVESEFFVIDGDSLMTMYIHNAMVDGEQNLHFFHLVECFLFDLIQKQATFVITFFKDMECIWNHSCSCLTLRTALILHLQRNTNITIYTEFSNCFDPKWENFLGENQPYFVMISDKAHLQERGQHHSTGLFHNLMLHTLGNGINVVITSGISQDILRVHGYHQTSNASVILNFQKYKADLKRAHGGLLRCAPAFHSKVFCAANENELMERLQSEISQSYSALKLLWPKGADVRRIVCAVSCSVALKIYGHMMAVDNSTGSMQGVSADEEEQREKLSVEGATEFCRVYCLHVALLCKLPLAQRSLKRNAKWKKTAFPFLSLRRMTEFLVLKKLAFAQHGAADMTYLTDMNDQQLFRSVATICSERPGSEARLGREIGSEYRDIWEAVARISPALDVGSTFPVTCSPHLLSMPTVSTPSGHREQPIPSIGLIPVSSEVVEEYLGEMLNQMNQLHSEDPTVASLQKLREFDERLHWHSSRPLTLSFQERMGQLSTDPEERKKMLRQKQKLVVFERLYAESLNENAELRIVTDPAEAAKTKSKCPPHPSKGKGMKPEKKKRSECIIEDQKKKKMLEEERRAKEQWNFIQETLGKDTTQPIEERMKTLDKFLKTCVSDQVKFDAEMEGVKYCYKAWEEHYRSTAEPLKDVKNAAILMQRIHTVLDRYEELLTPKQLTHLASYLQQLGFLNLRDTLMQRVDTHQLQKEKENKSLARDPKFPVGLGAARFQLKHMGPFLIRDVRNDPDPRVKHFIPDTWQRELLDAVDSNESAVIVAPTSSGKTYASYYCMEKVLRSSDDGIVVYVAPTKALVNQVVASVYGRFTKNLPQGKVVCGCFTRDYRSNVDNCQILITVPQCLEILLLSPPKQDWAKKIQYVIFDEVHCLGGEIGAEVWEHLLVMIRCPFLALSATISNPQDLTQWLQSVKDYWEGAECSPEASSSANSKTKRKINRPTERQSFKVRLVIYGERYNDLEKFVCDFEGGEYKFVPYHPCAALTVDHIVKYGIPSDLALSPAECLRLYDTMSNVMRGWPRMQELEPEEYKSFKNKIVIKKSDVREYEAELKKELTEWIEKGWRYEVKDVLMMLEPEVEGNFGKAHSSNYPLLVESLQKRNGLPAIFFIFNISLVEEFANSILKHLQTKEESRMKPDDNKVKQQMEKRIKELRKYLQKEDKPMHLSRNQEEKLSQLRTEYDLLLTKYQLLQEIPPDCTFAQITAADREFMDKVFDRMQWVFGFSHFREMMRRGIGCHHRSLNKKFRQGVEMLFRSGVIKVVSATSTLALGINMPCKTVVFLHDSVHLDSLTYRQMAGRAGRRGMDNVGSVMFHNVPLSKVKRLMKANVPQLRGQFPVTITFILRLMLLAAKSSDKTDAKAKVLSVLRYSLMTFNQPQKQIIVKYYFLFTLQFLLRKCFLDRECQPQGFAGLVMHLHYHEPANFVLIHFLMQGLLHQVCRPTKKCSKTFSEDVMETLVLILANLFGRRYFPPFFLEQKPSFQQSKVFLNDLPKEFAVAVNEYNRNALHVFGNFLLTISRQVDLEEEFKLPLTNTSFMRSQVSEVTEFITDLSKCLNRQVTGISPFACLSGHTDHDLFNNYDLDKIIFRTLGIHMNNIPILPLRRYDRQGRHMPLNAYALDFYKHGSLHALSKDNGINRGDAYALIKDFTFVISAISVSLIERSESVNDPVVLAFEQLNKTYNKKFRAVWS
ncbi:probable ATP-dependent RNA helicase DDX60 isoform X1 [Leucoraja erinacea]|uniref:probable ATP-dependent RNA helicase DDX60 isoform X1 n=1 Tax=Leucoraja erinaceus TaxID=7782 RepID=UPI0024581F0C|nr:probable ATP-dependent RNA helicase DDX60 isoform X1 [Leucoraja erinacea]